MKPACRFDPNIGMREFGVSKTTALLRDTVAAIQAAAKSPRPEPVHKMRVSIRRLQQAIRIFRQFFREKGVRSVRAELRRLMEPAGELRNCDIASGLVRKAAGDASVLRERRRSARSALLKRLSEVAQPGTEERWLRELGIGDGEEEKNQETLEG